jgi:hypothetical protein
MRLRPTAGGVFVDLGCGTGKAVFTAALSEARFSLCWGIEIVSELLEHAASVKDMFDELPRGSSASNQLKLADKSSDGSGTGTRKGAKAIKESSDADVIEKMLELFESSTSKSVINGGDGTRSLAADFVASKVCEALGHKAFKLFVKKHKSFTVFLKENCAGMFEVDSKYIRCLFSGPRIAGPPTAGAWTESDRHEEEEKCVGEDEYKEGEREDDRSECGDHRTNDLASRPIDTVEMAGDKALFEYIPEIRLDVGDIFAVPWWESANVVYVASLLFTDDMMERLVDLALKMRAGSVLISLKPFPRLSPAPPPCPSGVMAAGLEDRVDRQEERRVDVRPSLRLVSDSFYRMSWQMAQVLIYVVDVIEDLK